MGGTCLNLDCIPAKMLIHFGDVMQTVQNAAAFGIHPKVESPDWQFIAQRAFEEVDADAAMLKRGNWQSENVEVFKGRGRFTGLKAVTVEGFAGGFGGPYPAGGRRPECGLHHLHL